MIGLLLQMAIAIAGLIGWIANIVIIYHANFSAITGILILRIAGIFVAPLGAVLGYL